MAPGPRYRRDAADGRCNYASAGANEGAKAEASAFFTRETKFALVSGGLI